MSPKERPIFIVGVTRSGTTLLRYMLSSSPRIYIPPESDFIPYFFGRAPLSELSEARIAGILSTIFRRYRFVKEWQGSPPDARRFIEMMPARTPAAFLDTLYGLYALQYGAVRWGDKTPIYTSYTDLIHRMFPQAQFIHIIRDGRDVAVSMLETWGQKEFHVDIYFTARNWVRRVSQAQASGARLGPGHYYELRYEALVQQPERELQSVCDFLGESYVSEMAQPHLLGRVRIPPDMLIHAAVRHSPSTGRIRRWQRDMSPADQRFFQRIAGRLLDELGYVLADGGEMSLPEKARLLALGTKYEVLQAGRRILQAFGVFPPI